MSDLETALLEEVALLKAERTSLKEQITRSHQKNIHLGDQLAEFERLRAGDRQMIRGLENRVRELLRQIYGRRSEKIDVTQMVFDDIILAAEKCLRPGEPPLDPELAEETVREHLRRKHPGRKPLPAELPRVEHYLDIPEAEKVTASGKERPIIGVDVTERLDYRPAVFVVNRYIRPKYGADDDISGCGVRQHPPVDGPIDKCLADPGLLAQIIVDKYEHHNPLYRQEVKFERMGAEINRTTMAGWMARCAEVLKPLYEHMRVQMLAHDIVLNDDTPVQVLDPGSGKTHQGYMWCTVGGEGLRQTMFNFTMSRGRSGPSEFFKDYKGYLLTDDYAGYNEVLRQDGVVGVGCWAHVRRYFVDAQETEPRAATDILVRIARMYRVERDIKTRPVLDRLAARRKESRPELARILLWLRRHKRVFLPQSPMNKAIQHALKLRRSLTRYTRDGRLPIDNNPAENSIRPVALGRKNWLFVGSETGGETAAILMTFTATCRRLKINSWEYLRDILERINTHPMSKIEELLPERWQQLRHT